jgi:hypothetical protein
MRILLLNQFGLASGAPTGRILTELGLELERRGHTIHLVITDASYGKPRRGLARLLQEAFTHLLLLARGLLCPKADVIISLTSPACLIVTAAVVAKIHRARHIHWAMDLYPDLGVRLGELKDGALAGFFAFLMLRAYQATDQVIALDDDMRDYLRKSYTVDSTIIEPFPPVVTWPPARQDSKNTGKWLYSGNFGRAHEIEILLQVQKKLEELGVNAELILQGQGPQFQSSRQAAKELGLRQVQWHEPVPQEKLGESLLQSDVLVVTRKAELKGLLLPSKLVLAELSGSAILWIGDTDGKTAQKLSRQGQHGVFTIHDVGPITAWLQNLFESEPAARAVAPRSIHDARHQMMNLWEAQLIKSADHKPVDRR